MIYIGYLLIALLWGEDLVPKSPMQAALEANQQVVTKEYSVNIDGVQFHKVEVEGRDYYFRFFKKSEEVPIYLCSRPEGYQTERLIEATLKIRKRKVLYFQGLVEKCDTRDPATGYKTNNKISWIEVKPVIGIHIFDDENDLIRDKKIGTDLEKLKNGVNNLLLQGTF